MKNWLFDKMQKLILFQTVADDQNLGECNTGSISILLTHSNNPSFKKHALQGPVADGILN